MLKSESSQSKLNLRAGRGCILFFCLLAVLLTALPVASGQTPDFTLHMDPFPSPDAIDPGGTTAANITVGAANGFSAAVDLTCQVTWASQPTPPTPPVCEVSPPSVNPSGGASVTVMSSSSSTSPTTPLLYTITVTGTGPSTSHSQSQNLTVLAVSPQFTVTVQTAVAPSSVPAGNGGQGVVSVNPINGYSGVVTLSCSAITPLVTIPPVCSFAYPSGATALTLNGTPMTSTLTITTVGPVTTGAAVHPRGFYALWLPLSMLGLLGLGVAVGGKSSSSRKGWGLLALFVVSGALLLMPACGNSSSTSTTSPNGVTPANTYTFTVTGVDTEGNISSNTGTTTTNPTVSLTVTTPTTP